MGVLRASGDRLHAKAAGGDYCDLGGKIHVTLETLAAAHICTVQIADSRGRFLHTYCLEHASLFMIFHPMTYVRSLSMLRHEDNPQPLNGDGKSAGCGLDAGNADEANRGRPWQSGILASMALAVVVWVVVATGAFCHQYRIHQVERASANLQSGNVETRLAAIAALSSINGPEAKTALLTALKDKNSTVRATARLTDDDEDAMLMVSAWRIEERILITR
ncbi:MAG TPA: HEAT repeat domain-containing protein [Bacillota bacterium]|jgi:hypothetical protein|nr:HEAT repeat domain-containing protein [Bacillota bacterium]